MNVPEFENKVIAIMLLREGNSACTSVVLELANGPEGEKAYQEQIILSMKQAAEWGVPFVLEGAEDGI